MASVIEIQNPYYKNEATNILQYNNISSRYYLSHTINKNLLTLGDDIILEGFKVTPTLENGVVTFTVTPGKAICDLSLIHSLETVHLQLNHSTYDPQGEYIICMNHKFSEDAIVNAKLVAYYITAGGNTSHPTEFDSNRDRIILAHFNYQLVPTDLTFKSNIWVTVKSKQYPIYPISGLIKTQLEYVEKLELIYNYTQ